jgi:SAM-dependent methyltransferase
MAEEDGGSRYLYRQEIGGDDGRARLQLIGLARDPHTIRHLEEIGVSQGWRCIDVGSGGGSIARWLSERVGPTGRVVATDLETDALEQAALAHVEVVRHDILIDELGAEEFDLAYTRYLLIWLAQREEALRRIVSAVRPGGWVLVGDVDLRPTAPARPSEVFARVFDAFFSTMTGAGADIEYGERLPAALEAEGLEEVQAEGIRLYTPGGSVTSRLRAMTLAGVRDEMVTGGNVSHQDIDEALALLADPGFAWWTDTLWLARGRKPEGAH